MLDKCKIQELYLKIPLLECGVLKEEREEKRRTDNKWQYLRIEIINSLNTAPQTHFVKSNYSNGAGLMKKA